MHPDETTPYLQKLKTRFALTIKKSLKILRSKKRMIPFSVNKISYQVKILISNTDYCQVSYYDGENRKVVLKELFGKENILYFHYQTQSDVPEYFKIFINNKSKCDLCLVTIFSIKGIRELRFDVANNFPSGQWFICNLN
jgi:hypothetical protein